MSIRIRIDGKAQTLQQQHTTPKASFQALTLRLFNAGGNVDNVLDPTPAENQRPVAGPMHERSCQ